ncbi:MAG TPA: MFS transporter, partial [Pseudonocardiaceae bacterium]|nr:MFS transporter [Pseudonocardiaceae bacterium]
LDVVDWRLIFFINLPVGAVTLVLLARTQRSRRRSVPFDWVGQVTAVLAMGGLTYGAIEAGAVGVSAPQVLAALVVAAVAMVVFVAAQARGSHPMVPLEVFRSRNVVLLLVVGFTYMVGYYGMPFVFSLYFQQVRGLSALGAGALFVPMMLAGTVLTPFWPRIADRLGRKTLIAGGLSLMTIGLVVLGVLPGSTPVWLLSTLMILVGVGGPLVMPPATAVLLDSVPERRTGTVSGVFNTSRQVGGALAVAVFGGLLAGPGMFLRGVHTSLLIAAVVLAAAIPAGLLLRTHPTVSTETA